MIKECHNRRVWTIDDWCGTLPAPVLRGAAGTSYTMGSSILINMLFPIVMSKLATSRGGWITTIEIFMIPLTLLGICAKKFVKLEEQIPEWEEQKKGRLAAEAFRNMLFGHG